MSFDSNPDPGRTLGQFGIAVLALVVGAALLFLAIDRFSDDPVASPQPSPSATAAPTDTPTAAASETPAASTPSTEADTETASETETETAEPSPAATTESSATEDPSPSEDPSEDETEDDADRIDPGEISIQVLDAIKDGGNRAEEIADEMESDGYRVVAFNTSSIVYDETTVFYTEGYEDEADQVADDYGWDEVVFNDILSEDVNVHVVVGLDEQ